jgi:cytosine/adenosine deaminase-related metal-dependent hydrolase
MKAFESIPEMSARTPLFLRDARCATGRDGSGFTSLEITDGRISRVLNGPKAAWPASHQCTDIDLSGYLLMPGLINAHDHLEYSLHPRLADRPYQNYIEWGEDIHAKFPEVIARHRAVPKGVRRWWGGIRNLLCGVTTVAHHNPLWPELQQDTFPVRVVSQFGWAHSLALGGDLYAARAATPKGCPFILHACEGVDLLAKNELWELDRMGLLDRSTVLVHGLAIDREGVALLNERGSSLVVCPSSNDFLFSQLPDLELLSGVRRIALGNDSPLTATGNLLDEVHFAVKHCGISHKVAQRMVTTGAAQILCLRDGEGSITESGVADVIAIRHAGAIPFEQFENLSTDDVELVIVGGCVQLASDLIVERLPRSIAEGLEPLSLGAAVRWVRAPVSELLRGAEAVLGEGAVRLGGRTLRAPAFSGAQHAC